MNDNSLFSNDHVGGQFYWWIGQVCQSKFWRENLTNKPVENRDDIPGFGYRYKVRIMGIHDNPSFTTTDGETYGASDMMSGQRFVKNPPPTDEELPWCGVINSPWGGGEGGSLQTPGIRQGSFVFGFFLDGLNQQNPVIIGVLGNHFKYRTTTGEFKTFATSSAMTDETVASVPDDQIFGGKSSSLNTVESVDVANVNTAAIQKQKISLKKKQHLECVYKKDGAKGGLQVALGNLSDGLGLFQKSITEYPSALAKGEEKLNELLDKHLGDVTTNMISIMSLVESFTTASALEVAAVLISKADPSLKLKLTKAQEKQLKVLACMFGAISRGLGGKVKKAVKNKLFDNPQPIPEGYYQPSNPCFTEAIIADVMAQSIDEITDTMDSSNKNILEQASGLLGGLSNLSASALLPTGLLSGAISGGLGSIGGGLNLGSAMSFITGLTTFFACIKEASCPESDTLHNDGGESNEGDKVDLNNAVNQVKNGEIDKETIVSLQNKVKEKVELTNKEITENDKIIESLTNDIKSFNADLNNADSLAASRGLVRKIDERRELLKESLSKGVQLEKDIKILNEEVNKLDVDIGNAPTPSIFNQTSDTSFDFNSNLDYGNLTGVDYSKFVDDSNNYFKKGSEITAFEKPTEQFTVKKGPFTTTLTKTPTSSEIRTQGSVVMLGDKDTPTSSKADRIAFIKRKIEFEERTFRNLRGDIRRDTLNDLNNLRRDLNLLDGGNRQNYDWINLTEEQLKDKNLNLNDVPFEVIDPNKKIDPRYENF